MNSAYTIISFISSSRTWHIISLGCQPWNPFYVWTTLWLLWTCRRVFQKGGKSTINPSCYGAESSHSSSPERLYWHQCLVFAVSCTPCPLERYCAFIRFRFLNLFTFVLRLCAVTCDRYKKHLPITKYSGICSPHLCFILAWPSWSPCTRRKEQKLLPVVINASCNCMWHWDAILLWAYESPTEEWKKD